MQTDTRLDGDLRLCGLQLPAVAPDQVGRESGTLSVSQATTYRWTLEEDLEGLQRAGITGIGLYRPKVEELDEQSAADLIHASGLHVSSLSWVGGFTGCDGSKQAESLYDAAEAVRFAAAVSAGTVCLVSGGPGPHIVNHARRLLIDAVAELADMAGERGVRLALHPVSAQASRGQSFVTTLQQAADVAAKVDRPNVGLVFDLFQLGRDPDAAGLIPSLCPLTHLVKLSDRRGRGDVRRLIGDGGLPVGPTVREFLRHGYQGPFEIDLWSESVSRPEGYDALLASCRERFEGLLEDEEATG